MPLIPGRRTSNMRQSALRGFSEFKNSSADANTATSRRTDLISLSSDFRTEISSSTTEMRGVIKALHYLHYSGERFVPVSQVTHVCMLLSRTVIAFYGLLNCP